MKIQSIAYSNSFLNVKNINKCNFISKQQLSAVKPKCKIPDYRYFLPSFGAILYKKVAPEFESQKEMLKDELDIFSASKKNAQFLGKGLSAEAYALKKMPEIVVKYAFNKKETFENEQNNLELVPKSLEESQKFVARAYDDEENCYYLVSTKVKGDSADPQKMPWTSKHLKSLFDGLFKMDREGVYHGDLNLGNVKLTEYGKVNFIDFQWAHKVLDDFAFWEKEESTLPSFMYLENAQMFEMAELPYYIDRIGDEIVAKQFFKQYLKAKSTYHKNRYDYINYHFDEYRAYKAKKFEKARMVVFKNPTDEILKLEAKKIQFLSAFREAYKTIDSNVRNKNILSAGSSYLLAMTMAQDFRHEVATSKRMLEVDQKAITTEKTAILAEKVKIEVEQKEIFARKISFSRSIFPNSKAAKKDKARMKLLDDRTVYLQQRERFLAGQVDYLAYKKDYLDLIGEYGDFWFEKLKKWAPDAFDFPVRHVSDNLKRWETRHDFDNPNVKLSDFGGVVNVLNSLDKEYSSASKQNYGVNAEQINLNLKKNNNILRKLITSVSKPAFIDIKNKVTVLKELQKAINKASNAGSWLNVLNLSMLISLKTNELFEELSIRGTEDDEYLENVEEFAMEIENEYVNIAKNLFEQIYNEIVNYNPKDDYVLGYEKMETFT